MTEINWQLGEERLLGRVDGLELLGTREENNDERINDRWRYA